MDEFLFTHPSPAGLTNLTKALLKECLQFVSAYPRKNEIERALALFEEGECGLHHFAVHQSIRVESSRNTHRHLEGEDVFTGEVGLHLLGVGECLVPHVEVFLVVDFTSLYRQFEFPDDVVDTVDLFL